jgi:hypothetical protein
VDREAGVSAKGWLGKPASGDQAPRMTVRLPVHGATWSALTAADLARLGLAEKPDWLHVYGKQQKRGTLVGSWWSDPKIAERLHPDRPNDLQVVVHDGGPRITDRRPEAIWVRVTGQAGDVYLGSILNEPKQLVSVKQGQTIRFVSPAQAEYPLMVSEQYLRERPGWKIIPCDKCGLPELFDPPSELIKVIFPDLGKDRVIDAFTSFCGMCGGGQVVQNREFLDE